MTVTDPYTAVFSGGTPPGAKALASVSYNHLVSQHTFDGIGLTVDAPRSPNWLVTYLRVTVASSELRYGSDGLYHCPVQGG